MIPHNNKTWSEAFRKIIRSKKKGAARDQALDEFKAETRGLIEQGFNELSLVEILSLQSVELEKIDREKSEACIGEIIKIYEDRVTRSAVNLVNLLSHRALDELRAGRIDSGIKFADKALQFQVLIGTRDDNGLLEHVFKELNKWRQKEAMARYEKLRKEQPPEAK